MKRAGIAWITFTEGQQNNPPKSVHNRQGILSFKPLSELIEAETSVPQWWCRWWSLEDAPGEQKVALCILSLRVYGLPLLGGPRASGQT